MIQYVSHQVNDQRRRQIPQQDDPPVICQDPCHRAQIQCQFSERVRHGISKEEQGPESIHDQDQTREYHQQDPAEEGLHQGSPHQHGRQHGDHINDHRHHRQPGSEPQDRPISENICHRHPHRCILRQDRPADHPKKEEKDPHHQDRCQAKDGS